MGASWHRVALDAAAPRLAACVGTDPDPGIVPGAPIGRGGSGLVARQWRSHGAGAHMTQNAKLSLVFVALLALGCNRNGLAGGSPPAPDLALAPVVPGDLSTVGGPDLSLPDLTIAALGDLAWAAPGRCYGKPSRCQNDAPCGPPLATCQEGTCCTGVLDPVTCICHCNGGLPCQADLFCCTGNSRSPVQDRDVLKCRVQDTCVGW